MVPPRLQEEEWGVLSVCCLALVAVLLASEVLPCLPVHSTPCLLPSAPSPLLHGNCTGLSVCACMCAPVYTCIERYICGVRGGSGAQLRACSQETAHWSLSSAFCMGQQGGCGLVPLLSSVPADNGLSATVFLKLLLHLYERMEGHCSLGDCS